MPRTRWKAAGVTDRLRASSSWYQRALAEPRRSFSRDPSATVVDQTDKDLNGHTLPDIKRHLAAGR